MRKKILFILLILFSVNRVQAKETLVNHITNLYDSAEKNTATNGGKDYNYASSINLMNDRLGGTTSSLDGGNVRYYGANPSNYIDIGDRDSNGNVILWRIIGAFDGKLRIRRSDSIGRYSFDTSSNDVNEGRGINEWSQSDIMKLLNPGYESEQVGGSLWWNSRNGSCYSGENNASEECIFTSSGLSDKAKEYVVDQILYLGGFESAAVDYGDLYTIERGSNVFNNTKSCYGQSICNDAVERTTTWTGKVGLPYPSDFVYSTDSNGGSWMMQDYTWTVSPLAEYAHLAMHFGNWEFYDFNTASAISIVPVVTLNSNVELISGTGTNSDPYVIGNEEIVNEQKYSATINYYGEDGKLLNIDNNPYVLNNLPSGYTTTIKSPKVSGCYAKDVVINITDKDEVYNVNYNCNVLVNPDTGRIFLIFGMVLGITSISYLIYSIKHKKEIFD